MESLKETGKDAASIPVAVASSSSIAVTTTTATGAGAGAGAAIGGESSQENVLKSLEDCISTTQKYLLDLEHKMQIFEESQESTKVQYEETKQVINERFNELANLIEKARTKSLESLEDAYFQSKTNVRECKEKASSHVIILKDILHNLQRHHTSIQSAATAAINNANNINSTLSLSTSASSVSSSLVMPAVVALHTSTATADTATTTTSSSISSSINSSNNNSSSSSSSSGSRSISISNVPKLIARANHECAVLENPNFLVRKIVVTAGPPRFIEAFENHLQSLVLTTFNIEEVEIRPDSNSSSSSEHPDNDDDNTNKIHYNEYHTNTKLKIPLNQNLISPFSDSSSSSHCYSLSPIPVPKSLVPGLGTFNYRVPGRKFLVLSAASEKRALDVCVKIRSTVGKCHVDCRTNTTVSYDFLCNYDAVLVWVGGNLSFENSNGLGAHLNNYVRNGGGGVVVCPWALSTDDCGYGLRGDIVENGILGTELGECLSGTRMIWPPNKSADYYQKLYLKSVASKNNKSRLLNNNSSASPSRSDTATISRTSLDGFPANVHPASSSSVLMTSSSSSFSNCTCTSNTLSSPRGVNLLAPGRRIKLKESDDVIVDDDVTEDEDESNASFDDDDDYKSDEEDDYYHDDDVVSTHPIMRDVHIIDGGPYSGHHCIKVTESPECTVECAAVWEDRTPFVITTKSVDGSRYMTAVVNLYPVSSDFSSRCWNVNTDFATLLSNALHLVAKK